MMALSEVLWWGVALIDKLNGNPEWRRQLDGNREYLGSHRDMVTAIRWTRHRVGHQLVDAVEIRDGATYPLVLPLVFHTFFWLPTDSLPPPDPGFTKGKGKEEYTQHLAGRPVQEAIFELRNLFRSVMDPPAP